MRVALLLAAALAAPTLQRPAAEAWPPIALDVVVQDGQGRTVDTLGQADFLVSDAGGPFPVDAVRFVRARRAASPQAPGRADGPTPAPGEVGDDSRLFAIFLDEFHVTPGPGAERARAALLRFVRGDLGPGDFVAVLRPLDSLLDIRLSQDREAAIRAIERFEPRRGDYTPRTALEGSLIAGDPSRAALVRAQIAASALDALARHLGRFSPERKTLIVLSEGFVLEGHRDRGNMLPNLESTVGTANRAHVAMYPIDPRAALRDDSATGAPSPNPADNARVRESLDQLASGTSGRPVSVREDLDSSLRAVANDANGYYVLTFGRIAGLLDGGFHRVRVVLKRPGLTTRARAGYWAPSAAEARPAVSPAASGMFAARVARRRSSLVEPWFGVSRAADGAWRVHFVWEPVTRVPGDRAAPPVAARVALTVTTLDGQPVFEGVVMPSSFRPNAAGVSQAWFESPVGRLLVQMAIEDERAHVVDRDVRDLVVANSSGPVAIGSPEVLPAHNAREYRDLSADGAAAPVARRQFSRADRLLVRVPVFAVGADPVLVARLLSGAGAPMRELAVDPPSSPGAPFLVDLPLAGLPAGVYTVDLVARTPDGEARERFPLRITP